MRACTLTLAASALVCLAGCNREAAPAANLSEQQKAAIEDQARAYEAQVANEIAADEARLDKEADAFLNRNGQNAADADANEPAGPGRPPPP